MSRRHGRLLFFRQPVIFLEDFAQPRVRQRFHAWRSAPVIVRAATSAFTTASSVACTVASKRASMHRSEHLHGDYFLQLRPRPGIGGGKRDEDVAGTVPLNTAQPSEALRHALGDPLHLAGQQRCVGRHHHVIEPVSSPHIFLPVISILPERRRSAANAACRNCIAPALQRYNRPVYQATFDAVPVPPLNSKQIIPVPPPTLPSAIVPPCASCIAASASRPSHEIR